MIGRFTASATRWSRRSTSRPRRAVTVRLLTEELEIRTRYGKLLVPVSDVRRIEVGFRYPEGVERRVEQAVERLGSADFKDRDAAGTDLLRLKELAYPALKRATHSD